MPNPDTVYWGTPEGLRRGHELNPDEGTSLTDDLLILMDSDGPMPYEDIIQFYSTDYTESTVRRALGVLFEAHLIGKDER